MADDRTNPTAIADEALEAIKGGSTIIRRVEDSKQTEFHGSDFNASKTDASAAMGNSGHFWGSDFNDSKRK